MTEERAPRGKKCRITYRRKGWGKVEFVKYYDYDHRGLDAALGSFMRENSLTNEEMVRVEELEEKASHKA